VISVLERFAKTNPDAAIYDDQLAFTVVEHLLRVGDVRRARQYENVISIILKRPRLVTSEMISLAKAYSANGFKSEAVRSYKEARCLARLE
jgi:hypothetical protein